MKITKYTEIPTGADYRLIRPNGLTAGSFVFYSLEASRVRLIEPAALGEAFFSCGDEDSWRSMVMNVIDSNKIHGFVLTFLIDERNYRIVLGA